MLVVACLIAACGGAPATRAVVDPDPFGWTVGVWSGTRTSAASTFVIFVILRLAISHADGLPSRRKLMRARRTRKVRASMILPPSL